MIGFNAGDSLTSGIDNVSLGSRAGQALGAGSCNTFLGTDAGISNNGSNNIFIGWKSGGTSINSNSIAIGVCTPITSNNQLSIGSTFSWIGTASSVTAGSLAPVNVFEYLCVTINGQPRKIALYAV